MSGNTPTEQILLAENEELRARLEEAEEALRAIRAGEVDALVVETVAGPQIYTLQGLDAESNRFRGELLAQVSDAVVVVDNEQRLTYLNASAERQYGVVAAEVVGLPVTEFYQPRWLRPEDQAASVAALRETGQWRGELIHVLRSGATIQVEASVSRLRDANGAECGLLAVIRDIDVRVAAETALRRADRQKDEFLATLAHELRNPLAPIRMAVELIRRRDLVDETVRRARVVIERQVLHLSRLVDDLLDVSRITLGTIQLQQEPLDLGALAVNAIDSVRATLEGVGLTLEQLVVQPAPLVCGDSTRLTQCILNLVNNAVKFTPSGGRITLRVKREGPVALIEVSDTGSGISSTNLERIFELFVQEQASGFGNNTGLGIGLALTRKLVELHGGTVRAASAGPGQGSTFRIELPAVKAATTEQLANSKGSLEGAGARVLVVDDNHDAADMLGEMLAMSGFVIGKEYSGEAAVRAIDDDVPDAVLLDIGLPGIDGYEVCQRIRSMAISRQPVVIALTGWGQDRDRNRAAEAGFDGHLTKPAEPGRVIALLQELLAAPAGGTVH
jgi:PAS domain S-box-containing protein